MGDDDSEIGGGRNGAPREPDGSAGGDDVATDGTWDTSVDGGDSGLDSVPDGVSDDSPVSVPTVEVWHSREMRGAWIATVSRINWPTSTNASQQKAQLESILDAVKAAGLNAVFFQVRPEADAFYASSLEPWSRYLTGTQGQNPGYDPLEYAIASSHRRGIELHAWLNPYRARSGNAGVCSSNHISKTMPQAVVSHGNDLWIDPGHPGAFEHTMDVVEDLLRRYDVDGIHFDDYFYPYPISGVAFPDDATFTLYGSGMTRGDWRRDNVNRMVASVGNSSRELRPDVRWGIAPFGIYRPGVPPGVTGLDQYSELYADPVKWLREGWVEYLAPQLYWKTTAANQPYGVLLGYWDARAVESGRRLFVGNSSSSNFGLAEYRAEMNAMAAVEAGTEGASSATRGAIWYNVNQIVNDSDGLATMLAAEYYGRPAATPQLIGVDPTRPLHPTLSVIGGLVTVLSSGEGMRYWAVYRQVSDSWELHRLVPALVSSFELSDGTWAISVIDRSGRESVGVVTDVGGELDAGSLGTPDAAEGGADAASPSYASCTHTYGGVYVHMGCSPSYQCCDGTWRSREYCGSCVCEEATGRVGCGM